MKYARLIRAPVAGTLVSLYPRALPDGYYFVTVKDIPGKKSIKLPGGAPEIFASSTVPHPGAPVAMVVGADPAVVDRIRDTAVVHVNPAGVTRRAALVAHREVNYGNDVIDDVCNSAAHSVTGCYRLDLRPAIIPECAGAIADYRSDGTLVIYTATEWVRALRESLAAALDMEAAKITINKTIATERNSNAIWQNILITVRAAVASKAAKAPVKLSLTRGEHEAYVSRLMHITVRHKTALDSDGTLTAMHIAISANAGSFNPFADEIIDRLVISAVGPYCPKNLRVTADTYKTPAPPGGLYFSWLDYSVTFALESHIAKVAAAANISPALIREKNVPPAGAAPPAGFPFDLGLRYFHDALRIAVTASDFERKWGSYTYNSVTRDTKKKALSLTEPIRGIGLAAGYTGSAFFGSTLFKVDQEVTVTKNAAGAVTVAAALPSKAIATIWTTIIASVLDIDSDAISFTGTPDLDRESRSPDLVFNNSVVMAAIIKKCCRLLRNKDGAASIKRGITAKERAQWSQLDFRGTPFFSTANAAATVELVIDPYTKLEHILGVWFAIDCGKVYAMKEVEKTVRRACQNIFSRLVPHQIIDPTGIHLEIVPSESEAQNIGNLIYKILPAAYGSALTQARCHTSGRPL
jgi:CO/xanthine dehydrogenase Mo-binding subunit